MYILNTTLFYKVYVDYLHWSLRFLFHVLTQKDNMNLIFCFLKIVPTTDETDEGSVRTKTSTDKSRSNNYGNNNNNSHLDNHSTKQTIPRRLRSPRQQTLSRWSPSSLTYNSGSIASPQSPSSVSPMAGHVNVYGNDNEDNGITVHGSLHQIPPAMINSSLGQVAEYSANRRQRSETGNLRLLPSQSITTLPIGLDLAPSLPMAPPPYLWWLYNRSGAVSFTQEPTHKPFALASNSKRKSPMLQGQLQHAPT